MNLENIITKINLDFEINGPDNIGVEDVHIDSRLIENNKNSIFFALDGKTQNGDKFIDSAIENGAKIIVAKSFCDNQNVISIKTDDVFEFLAQFLKIYYQNIPENIYAVTGTNGKTSVAEFGRQILSFLEIKSASIGTIGVNCDDEIKEKIVNSSLTTPDIVTFFKNLAILKENGINDVFVEASSIGLDQKRIYGVEIDVAGFTNFSQDHLDYHRDMDDYFEKKMILFDEILSEDGFAVLNADIQEFDKICEIVEGRELNLMDYGRDAQILKLNEIKVQNNGQKVSFSYLGNNFESEINISGDFQGYNLLCALGMVLAKYELSENEIRELLLKLKDLTPAEGRMEKVADFNGAQIFIDFAHSPDALENVLKNAKNIKNERLIVMFGCGGDRDRDKRPIMGKIACELADLVIVSDDNPRSESPEAIRKDILRGCDLEKVIEVDGRKNAIEKSLQIAKDGDIIVLAGKGHEKYQILKDRKIEFDEKEIVKEFVENN